MEANGTGLQSRIAVPAAQTGGNSIVVDSGAAPKPAESRERFIPVTRYELATGLFRSKNWHGEDADAWRRALYCLAAWRHQHYRERLLTLLRDYLLFSPDNDTVKLQRLAGDTRENSQRSFIAGVEGLLERGNYTRISEADLQRLLRERTPYGLYLEVDLSEYEELLLFYRGCDVEMHEERNPWRFYLAKERFEVPIFKRLFLLVKLKSEEVRIEEIMRTQGVDRDRARKILHRLRAHLPARMSSEYIYLKIFKRIAQIDLEMLFPNTRIAFKPLDKLKLGVTAGGGTVAGVMGSVTKAMAATNPFALAGALVALAAVLFRQVSKFFHTRNRYMMELAQNLYFHNLANNRGALTLLADRAEEEDVKEDMLLYAFLAEQPIARDELSTLDRRIEAFLRQACGVTVNFDAEDALARLLDYGVVEIEVDGTLRALAPDASSRQLDRLWDHLLDDDKLSAMGV